MIIILLLYYLIAQSFHTFQSLFPNPKLEIKKSPIIDATLIRLFLEEGTFETETHEVMV